VSVERPITRRQRELSEASQKNHFVWSGSIELMENGENDVMTKTRKKESSAFVGLCDAVAVNPVIRCGFCIMYTFT